MLLRLREHRDGNCLVVAFAAVVVCVWCCECVDAGGSHMWTLLLGRSENGTREDES